MQEKVIFFSKINLVSEHIFQVYEKKIELNDILDKLLSHLVDGITYTREKVFYVGTEPRTEKVDYTFNIFSKGVLGIEGNIFRTSNLYYNTIGEDNTLIPNMVKNSEASKFFFDVYNEIVAFDTTIRFGYQDFTESFMTILNICMKSNDLPYRFDAHICTHGLDLDEIKKQLKSLNKIEELVIEIQPPNPDSELLDNIRNEREDTLTRMQDGNVTTMSYMFSSKGQKGLNIDSTLISETIQAIEEVHSTISTAEMTKKNYAKVEAKTANGYKYSTRDSRPVKRVVNLSDFVKSCKDGIASIIINKTIHPDKNVGEKQ